MHWSWKKLLDASAAILSDFKKNRHLPGSGAQWKSCFDRRGSFRTYFLTLARNLLIGSFVSQREI